MNRHITKNTDISDTIFGRSIHYLYYISVKCKHNLDWTEQTGQMLTYHSMAITNPRYELLKEESSLNHNKGLETYISNVFEVQIDNDQVKNK